MNKAYLFFGAGTIVIIAIVALIDLSGSATVTTRSTPNVSSQSSLPTGISNEISGTAIASTSKSASAWKKEFQSSTDYFVFVSKAAKYALEGDGRAALYVSQVLRPCLLMTRLYGANADPETAIKQALASQPNTPSWLVDRQMKEFRACAGFFKGDAFVDLPNRIGGYNSPAFWSDLAYQYNDPIAQTFHAASAIGNPLSPNPHSIEIAQTDIDKAIESGDPEAIFRAGFIMTNGLSVDPIQGYAFSIAACDLGYDCSAGNSDDAFFAHCVALGNCQAGAVFSDVVTQAIGVEGYARAYDRAQQIERALSEGDAPALQQFAQLGARIPPE